MATRFYLNIIPQLFGQPLPPDFLPSTIRGGWDTIPPWVFSGGPQPDPIILLDVTKTGDPIYFPPPYKRESPGNPTFTPNRVLVLRTASFKLDAQTISGNVNIIIAPHIDGAPTTARIYWATHIYVTQGDTNLIRGTLVNNYAEDTPSDYWNNSASFPRVRAFNAPITLNPVTTVGGDRIIVEIGYITRVLTASSVRASIYFGSMKAISVGNTSVVVPAEPDLFPTIPPTNGPDVSAGSINFSQTLLLEPPPAFVAHIVSQVARPAPPPPAELVHIVTQTVEKPGPATSLVSHIIVQVVPPAIPPPPDASGLYFINRNKAAFHDSYYNFQEVKIPDPTIRTALLGE